MRILVDGYNLLRSVPELAWVEGQDPEGVRFRLLSALAVFRTRRRHSLTVVFDGSAAGGAPKAGSGEGKNRTGGITVLWSRPPKSADDIIAELSRSGAADLVVTSDAGIRARVGRSAQVMPSADFWERLEAERMRAEKGEESGEEEEGPPPSRPGRRLSKKARRARALRSRL